TARLRRNSSRAVTTEVLSTKDRETLAAHIFKVVYASTLPLSLGRAGNATWFIADGSGERHVKPIHNILVNLPVRREVFLGGIERFEGFNAARYKKMRIESSRSSKGEKDW
ncbi:hypothetical protein QQS21_009562, partial [Conoideocrella luteorostrata]